MYPIISRHGMMILDAIADYSKTNFDPANVYLAVSAALLSLCVYFLKRHVDGQDKLNILVSQLLVKVEVIESNSKTTNEQVKHISERVDEIQEKLNEHEVEISLLKGVA